MPVLITANEVCSSRVAIVCGHFGTGKTEFAVNYILELARGNQRTMIKEIIISGFGGQGVMSIGKSLVEAGMEEGLNVTWAPSYGPEMRGGTANCSVVLSDKLIGSPVFTYPTELIAMNAPSLEKFESRVVKDGLIFVNSSVVNERVERVDLKAVYVPCETIAYEVGNPKVANMSSPIPSHRWRRVWTAL